MTDMKMMMTNDGDVGITERTEGRLGGRDEMKGPREEERKKATIWKYSFHILFYILNALL